MSEDLGRPRSHALDRWDYRGVFAPFHIQWGEAVGQPAFEAAQAYGIAVQELHLDNLLTVWGHREVLVSFSSDHIQVGAHAATGEMAWVVIVAGLRTQGARDGGIFERLRPGAGAIVQALIDARTGEVLLGTAVPVSLTQA